MRQCYYLPTENAISPVSDTDFYGAEPMRISQEQLDAREKLGRAGEGRQAPDQPDEEILKNGQKAVAVTTWDSGPEHAMRRRSPHRMAVWSPLRAVAMF